MRSARCSACARGATCRKPPVGLGSHLDTQPTGGKFDGVLGTLAALEVVRTLNDAGIETETADLHLSTGPTRKARALRRRRWRRPPMPATTPPTISCRARTPRASASARRSTASAIAATSPSAHASSAPSSNCTSNRARCWRPRTRPSAWSIAARASSGTTARSPASKAMPAPRRCRCAATRSRRCRKSCWRWSASRRRTARTRSAPSAKP